MSAPVVAPPRAPRAEGAAPDSGRNRAAALRAALRECDFVPRVCAQGVAVGFALDAAQSPVLRVALAAALTGVAAGRLPVTRLVVAQLARVFLNRSAARALALAAAALFVAWIIVPHAEGQQVVNGMAEEWRRASLVWAARLMRNAQRLFVTLAGFEVVASGMVLLLKPKRLDEAAGGFVLKILVMSVCFFSITSFELVVPKLFDSFVVAGQTAAFIPSLNPSQVAGMGIMLAGKMMAGAVVSALAMDQVTFVFAMVCAFLVALAFCGIACQIVYCLVEGYVVMGAGVFFLGFAAFGPTATFADNYLTYVMYSGIKIMMLYLLVPVGVSVIGNWPTIPPLFDLADPIERLIGVSIFCGLVMFLPGSFASRITGGASLGIAQALRNN